MLDPQIIAINDCDAYTKEQGARCRKLFVAVVLTALDDAISDQRTDGSGTKKIAKWAASRDGCEVLSCAGIEPNPRVVKSLVAFVERDIYTYNALTKSKTKEADS